MMNASQEVAHIGHMKVILLDHHGAAIICNIVLRRGKWKYPLQFIMPGSGSSRTAFVSSSAYHNAC